MLSPANNRLIQTPHSCSGTVAQMYFRCLASPISPSRRASRTVLALLDELERKQQYIKRRDQENEDIALTVGRLRVELEGKDRKIANLTAELRGERARAVRRHCLLSGDSAFDL